MLSERPVWLWHLCHPVYWALESGLCPVVWVQAGSWGQFRPQQRWTSRRARSSPGEFGHLGHTSLWCCQALSLKTLAVTTDKWLMLWGPGCLQWSLQYMRHGFEMWTLPVPRERRSRFVIFFVQLVRNWHLWVSPCGWVLEYATTKTTQTSSRAFLENHFFLKGSLEKVSAPTRAQYYNFFFLFFTISVSSDRSSLCFSDVMKCCWIYVCCMCTTAKSNVDESKAQLYIALQLCNTQERKFTAAKKNLRNLSPQLLSVGTLGDQDNKGWSESRI